MEGTIYVERPKLLLASDMVDEMFKSFVVDLILVAIYQNKSCVDASAEQVREWIKKLRKFTESDNKQPLKFIEPVSLEWMMYRAATELQIEIETYFIKKKIKNYLRNISTKNKRSLFK